MKNYKKLEDRINSLIVAKCNINKVKNDIDKGIDEGRVWVKHCITELEQVEINVYTLEIIHEIDYSAKDIKKAYAIKESNPEMNLKEIMDKKLYNYYLYDTMDQFKEDYIATCYWDNGFTEDDKIEIMESDMQNLIKTSWGYLEV